MSSGEADTHELVSNRSSSGPATIETPPVVDVFHAGEVGCSGVRRQEATRRAHLTFAVRFQPVKR
jgi:hypothetical protein